MARNNTRFYSVLRLCSLLTTLYSLSMLGPIFCGLIYHESNLRGFYLTFAAALSIGVIGYLLTLRREGSTTLHNRDGFLVAVLFWLIFSTFSALPFILDTRIGLSFSDALFEGISGITTTGASIFSDIEPLPKSILYYRAQLNFLGGLGIIVLAIAILPLLGIGGSRLYRSEMPGPLKEEKLTPRLADTAKHLWLIYLGLTLACALSFWLAGMKPFDALCHALSTLSLGGFSTHTLSIGFYNSAPIEWVAGIFSALAAVNFALYFVVLSRRSLTPLSSDPELRFFSLILLIVCSITCIELYRTQTFSGWDSLTHGFFQATSVMTDNGLGTVNYPAWPTHIVMLLLGASYVGGCVGSTCGGIKALRFLLLYRQSSREIDQLVHPNGVYSVTIGGHPIAERVLRSVWSLFFFYIFFTCLFILGLTMLGYDLPTAFGTVSACINNMGIGYGETAAGFGTLSDPAKLLMCLAMLFGRLEIFPILIVCSRTFWRF